MPVNLRPTTDLLPLIAPYAPSCPAFLAEQMIRFAAIEFAERTRAWRHIAHIEVTEGNAPPLLSGVIGEQEYDLLFTVGHVEGLDVLADVPAVAVIHEIEFAEFDGQRLTPVQFSTIASETTGAPQYITQVAPNALTLIPFQPGKLSLSVFLKPASGSDYGGDADNPLFDAFNVVPDFFVTLHGDTIANGALARILSIPNEPWTDEAKAALYEARFREKLKTAFRSNMRGQQRAKIRTPYRDF